MSEDDEQLRVRVAWLYFMEGLTQADIATRLGITRLRANRLLGEARESGLVNIQVNARLADCVALERALVAETGLKDAVIVPTPADAEQIATVLGRATADYLARHLGENRARALGIGWGATLRETVRHLAAANLPELSINSMMGGLTYGSELNTFEIASEFARRVNAQCNYLAAPIYSGSPKSRDTILAQDVFRETFQRLAAIDVALMSVGDLEPPLAADPLRPAARRHRRGAALGRRGRRHHGHVPRCRRSSGPPSGEQAGDRAADRHAAQGRHGDRGLGRAEQDRRAGRACCAASCATC